MDLSRTTSVQAVQWTGKNKKALRDLLTANVAFVDDRFAVIQVRDDGTYKSVLGRGPYTRQVESGEYEEVGTGNYRQVIDADGVAHQEEITRKVPIMVDEDVPGEWVVVEDGLVTIKADVTIREQYPELEG